MRAYWADDDIEYHFEIDRDGYVQRHVEVVRATGEVLGAADLDEWNEALRAGTVGEYEARYGGVAEGPVDEWDPDWPHESVTVEVFEAVWLDARQMLEARPRP